MKLYSNVFAPSPRRVRMFAAEKGVTLEIVNLDIAKSETQGAAFLALNPMGDVPVLVLDDGTTLTESLAINRYLEALVPLPPLLGTTPLEQARINECVDHLMFRLYVPTTHAFRHTHAFWNGRVTQVPAYGDVAREAVRAQFAWLEARLADGREFLIGAGFTLADIVAYTSVDFAKIVGLRADATYPSLQAYQARIAARPSAKA